MSRRRINWILVCLGMALSTGCTSIARTTPTPEASTPQVQPSAPTATPKPGSRSSGAVITFARSGGIAGISEQWSIYEDGRVIGPAGEVAHVPEVDVSRLIAEIEAAGFFEWPASPRVLRSCADCFTYSIVVSFEGKSNQLTLVDGQTDAPEGASLVLERIQAVLASRSD